MIFYGASGHAKVIIEAWVASGGTVTGIMDDNPAIQTLWQFKISGPYATDKFVGHPIILAVGSNQARKVLNNKVQHQYGKVAHPQSVVSASAGIQEGTVLMAGAIINADSSIGRHVIINTAATVDHDCIVGDYAHLSPNATLCGGVRIGEGTHIGAGAVILPGIYVGKWATIGAGSVITKPVADYAVVTGAPGKLIRMNPAVF
jgi:sugar O-acyltransferase (sialic acid O-acetyltransferase NeuD family)